MANGAGTDFDAYRDDYREAVERSIGFARTEMDFFTRAKVRELLELSGRHVGDPRRLSFLDVGCGPGETDRLLEGRVAGLAGVDVAAQMVDAASERNPWAQYRHVEAGQPLPYEAGTFDVCFAVCVLHHVPLPERRALVQQMARVTRPDGMVAVFEHNPWNPLTRRAVTRCEFDEDAVLLSRREAERLLRDSGLGEPEGRYILFFTSDSAPFRWIERRLRKVPLGAQYVVCARPG
jgi:SAM-dependent methyltransferase